MSRTSRFVRAAALLGGCVYAALVWTYVLPGRWRLENYVAPHAIRESRERAAHHAARLTEFEEELAAPGAAEALHGAIVFMGSSTIERFPLAECFPGVATVNRGIGDESLAQLEGRLLHALPPEPRGFVVYAGSIDVRFLPRELDAILAGVGHVLARLDAAFPRAEVIVLGLLPERDPRPETGAGEPQEGMSQAVRARLDAANARLEAEARAVGATFVATDVPPLRDERGALAKEYAADALHLNETGYRVLARRIIESGGSLGRMLGGD